MRDRGEAQEPGFLTGFSLLLPITLSTMAIVLLAPILPQLMSDFSDVPGYEYWVPMILTIPALCVALFSPFGGMLGDWFGRRRLLLASFLAYALVGVAPLFLTSLPAILISRVGVGVAEALIMVLSTTLIGDYYKGAARDKWLAGQTAFASLSALLFFNLGGQLGVFGWRAPFWVYASALLMFVLVLRHTWEPRCETGREKAQSTGWAGFPWRRMLIIMAITIYGSIFFYTVQIQASSGLHVLGMSDPARIGFLTSVASIGVPMGTLLYSRIGRWPVRGLLLLEFILLAIGFGIMGLAREWEAFLMGCFLNQIGAGLLLPTLLVWAMSLLSFEIRGRGAGMWQSSFAFGQFLSPVVVTLLSKQAGGLMAAFGLLSLGALIGVILALVVPFRRGEQAMEVAVAHG
ncbi:Predicted arabinose efflux permease, MFS family [Sphingobium sp. AP50]|uniref:MFS transporter n=1 Tax=Sphingobium sp. AP50 TaxID=1884369 RepID=UPI0008D671E4|nr:MFS transporter [Sphingobium sp. AP50]SEJ15885.1 Predicted arabinose efflux permease, MFS family [Sphingobium sp. AP50]